MEAIPPFRFRRQKAQKFFKKHQDRESNANRTSVSSLEDSSTYDDSSKNSTSSSFQMNYSVNSQSEYGTNISMTKKKYQHQHHHLKQQSIDKRGNSSVLIESSNDSESHFKSVKELAMQFEKLSKDEKIIFANRPLVKLRSEVPWLPREELINEPIPIAITTTNEQDEEIHSEDEVDKIVSDGEEDVVTIDKEFDDLANDADLSAKDPINDNKPFDISESIDEDHLSDYERNKDISEKTTTEVDNKFIRNFRSKERPKTELVAIKNQHVVSKYYSYNQNVTKGYDLEGNDVQNVNSDKEVEKKEDEDLNEERPEVVAPIIEELIKTEESYIENLRIGIKNYGTIFKRKDLPSGLRGKKFDLLGNVEQICDFHEFEFLPMLQKYKSNLKNLFDEFLTFIDENCFYGYVLFTMNKKRSLKLCEEFNPYFKYLQEELDDKLGINSFLVQPIQRLARYPLLLTQFINTLFKTGDIKFKSIIESCCKADKRLRILLTTTNESEQINDIADCFDVDVLNQGRFMKVSEFSVFDYTLRRTYRSKAFIFDRCVIYTEIKDKRLLFRGCYPCESIGFIPKAKMFILYYQTRKIQECHFTADSSIIDLWLVLIQDIINNFVTEEKKKLTARYAERYSNDLSSSYHHRPNNIQKYRYSNRFSSDSGIGNVWNMPKPTDDEDKLSSDKLINPKTTWYMT